MILSWPAVRASKMWWSRESVGVEYVVMYDVCNQILGTSSLFFLSLCMIGFCMNLMTDVGPDIKRTKTGDDVGGVVIQILSISRHD